MTYFEKTVLKLLVMIYNNVRDPSTDKGLFTDSYGQVYRDYDKEKL